MAAIEIENLCFRYGSGELVLDGFSLTIADGEAHAILGGSGAGKTTLLNLLAGLLQPVSGSIRFNGNDVVGLDGAARNVAQVFQFPVLYPSLNAADNIGFPLGNRGWRKQAIRSKVQEIAELLEITPLLRKRPRALSLFEKQLVAIGRALARPDVAVILLDEPLTAVAPTTKWRLRQALKSIQRELALTMVYVTHDQTEALSFADRITMLHQGAALQTGTPQELYQTPAHRVVAQFIGSPGMNLARGEAKAGRLRIGKHDIAPAACDDGPCSIGFRPEWARLELQCNEAELGIPVTLAGIRTQGTEQGVPVGLVSVHLGDTTVHVRQRLHWLHEPQPTNPTRSDRADRANASDIESPQPTDTAYLHIDPNRLVVYRNDALLSR